MIKINLLPRIIDQKRILRNTALFFAFLLSAVIAGGMAYGFKLRGDVQKMEELATVTEQWETKVKGIQQQAQQMRDGIKPIKQKLDFINQVLEYNGKYPALYEEIAKWTYEKVTLYSLACDGKEVKMQARAKSLDDLGRYLLNMYRATNLFTEVTISSVPSYKSLRVGSFSVNTQGGFSMPSGMFGQGGDAGGSMANLAGLGAVETGVARTPINPLSGLGIAFEVTCKLKTPIEEPKFAGTSTDETGAGGAGAPFGGPGMEGMPGGAMPGGPGGAPPMPGPGGPEPGAM